MKQSIRTHPSAGTGRNGGGTMERFLDAHHFAGKSRFRLNAPLLNGIGEKEDPRYSKSRRKATKPGTHGRVRNCSTEMTISNLERIKQAEWL
jgi:hypothetical protein